MFKSQSQRTVLATCVLLAFVAALPASAQTHSTRASCIGILPPAPPLGFVNPPPAPDSGLYTSYTFSNGYTSVFWSVCGSTQGSDGCYDSGTLGPFGKAGAVIEGNPVVNFATSTVTRNIYVVDEAANGGTGVALYVYTKTDVVGSTYDTITVNLTNTIPLPSLTGGTSATTYMAANDKILFIATNQGTASVEVQKTGLAVTQIGGFGDNVSAITANQYGYVDVTYGNVAFETFRPDGSGDGGGGGAEFVAGTQASLSTANLATATSNSIEARLAARVHVRLKKLAPPSTP